MNTTTLRGIFPDPKPVPRRNFMKENIKQLKQMQGLIQPSPKSRTSPLRIESRYKNIPSRVYSTIPRPSSLISNKTVVEKEKIAPKPLFVRARTDTEHKITHRGVQTDNPEDLLNLYATGVLKYPTLTSQPPSQSPKHKKDQGDYSGGDKASNILDQSMQKLKIEEKHDYIKENMKNIKQKNRIEEEKSSPPCYRKGVIPKYLRERKEELKGVVDGDREQNPPGLVLLPEDERKEYLRVARENYAALIKELNSMPVRNDTLKKRKRKVEIEEELKRLDEVIKIFQKPKVFVKADA